jgi:hypothetical protein
MTAIRIRRKLESDTLHLPELKPLIGREVEIIVREEAGVPAVTPGTGDWAAVEEAARELRAGGYDFDAWKRQREFDAKHAQDHPL